MGSVCGGICGLGGLLVVGPGVKVGVARERAMDAAQVLRVAVAEVAAFAALWAQDGRLPLAASRDAAEYAGQALAQVRDARACYRKSGLDRERMGKAMRQAAVHMLELRRVFG